jgi:hypothetical protein
MRPPVIVLDPTDKDAVIACSVLERALVPFRHASHTDILPWLRGDVVVFLGVPEAAQLDHAVRHCESVYVLARTWETAFDARGLTGWHLGLTLACAARQTVGGL